MRLALYQPEIPQNTGTLLRLGACLNISLDIIEPCGFIWNDQKLRRAGMDYIEIANVTRHRSWKEFLAEQHQHMRRVILLDPQAPQSFLDFHFQPNDVLLLGKESSGVPASLLKEVNATVTIPMAKGTRSLNMAISASMVLGEALRQTNQFPILKGE